MANQRRQPSVEKNIRIDARRRLKWLKTRFDAANTDGKYFMMSVAGVNVVPLAIILEEKNLQQLIVRIPYMTFPHFYQSCRSSPNANRINTLTVTCTTAAEEYQIACWTESWCESSAGTLEEVVHAVEFIEESKGA